MEHQALIQKVRNITTWSRDGERAINKPLMLLLALSKLVNEDKRLISYAEVDLKLKELLREFGPQRTSYHPEYPFWRLKNDGIWEVCSKIPLTPRKGNTDIPKLILLSSEATAGFDVETYKCLKNNDELVREIMQLILNEHFPSSLHGDILSAVGLDVEEGQGNVKKKRCPEFREKILSVYGHKCAICGFDLRLGNSNLALEAAHIKWHQAGGPDTENNGMALCVLHHKLFDRGAITIDKELNVVVSIKVNGSCGNNHVDSFHGAKINLPKLCNMTPDPKYIGWHNKEVFRGPSL